MRRDSIKLCCCRQATSHVHHPAIAANMCDVQIPCRKLVQFVCVVRKFSLSLSDRKFFQKIKSFFIAEAIKKELALALLFHTQCSRRERNVYTLRFRFLSCSQRAVEVIFINENLHKSNTNFSCSARSLSLAFSLS